MNAPDEGAAARIAEAEGLMDRARNLLRRSNAPEALKVGRQLEQRRYSGGFEIQARALLALGRRKQAIAALERGVKNVPANWSLWQYLGSCRSDDGDYDGAFAAYDRALACDCDPVHVAYNYANALVRAGRWADARIRVEPLFGDGSVAATDPELGFLLVDLFEAILLHEGRDDEATELIEAYAGVIARGSK